MLERIALLSGEQARSMKRREFLTLSGRSLAGMSVLTALPIPLRGGVASRQSGIVVVGAGLSGLTAAFELRRVGLDVVVLEAESRPGGRVRT
ncbi:MAG TPA: FAD-dependent oxidoreductase, partial [Dehalococcoidia bacterium]|nr:FAD-dependent oxidoreductase [Dehalococcoidia bacterium]